MKTPNVNFFIHSVPCLDGLGVNHPLVKKYFKERQFYSCEQSYNYLGYVNDGSKKQIDFVEYSGNNEKSTGLFDKTGLCSQQRIKELKQGFRDTKSQIWHGLVSFEEMFGKTFCGSYEKSYEMMSKIFPRFLRNAGLDVDNIEWCAGFHTNTDHKHIHFSFYEKEPLKYRKTQKQKCFSYGQVTLYSIEKAKLDIENCLTQTSTKLAQKRKELTKEFQESITQKRLRGDIIAKMKKMIILLPASGRLAYDSDNMMFMKNKINCIVDSIIKQDDKVSATYRTFLTLLNEKDESIKRMCEASKINPDKVVLYDKYIEDLYRRLGNHVIKSIINTRNQMKLLEFATDNRLAKKRIQRRKMDCLLQESLYLNELVQKEAMQYFEEHMKVLKEMEIKVLIEQGIIQI